LRSIASEIGHIYTFDRRGTGVADMVPDQSTRPNWLAVRRTMSRAGILAQIAGDAVACSGDLGHDASTPARQYPTPTEAPCGRSATRRHGHAGSCRGNDADLVRQAHGRPLPQCRNLS
jgi:hypothetical protein